MSNNISPAGSLHFFTVAIVGLFVLVTPVAAQQNATISQGYQTNEDQIVNGALVSLASKSENIVEYATPQRVERLIGVVDDDSLIALSTGTKQVQVATSGKVLTLVSNINGDIK